MTLIKRSFVLALISILIFAVAACGNDTGTAPPARSSALTADAAPSFDRDRDDDREHARVFSVTGDLSDGGSFRGRLKLQGFSAEAGKLIAHAELSGVARTRRGTRVRVQQTLEQPVQIATSAAPQPGAFQVTPAQVQPCSVLTFGFGVIAIQVLQGTLDLTLSLISIDLNAGNVLGSLLCSLVQLQV